MLRLQCLSRLSFSAPLVAILLLFSFFPIARGEVIYDNSSTFLNTYFNQRVEYGDQLDLEGTARRLTQILFEYYGDFVQDGDERVKVRLYTNETPYDRYRNGPTTVLYESGWMPIKPGYNTHFVGGLNVQLPQYTVTFTVEFSGIGENETVGLLFYDPPTVGYSFNEIWMRGLTGIWVPVLYSTSDPLKRASIGLRLLAEVDTIPDQQNTSVDLKLPMVGPTNVLRFAQTFSPEVSGRLNHVVASMQFSNAPVLVRILDTVGQAPGPNVLGSFNWVRGTGNPQPLFFSDQAIYLKAGATYAIEWSTTASPTQGRSYLLPVARDPYEHGRLWQRNETAGQWTPATTGFGQRNLDARFETFMISSEPFTIMTSPHPNATFDAGESIVLKARHRTPEIGEIVRVRFIAGTNEIATITNAPFSFVWTNAAPGEHFVRAIADDTFRRPFRSEYRQISVRGSGSPLNDNFTNRLSLSGLFAGSTKPATTATLEPDEPRPVSGYSGKTLWWSWTAYDNSPVTLRAQSSSGVETSVAVYQGSLLPHLTWVNDGISETQFIPEPGRTYSIVVEPKTPADFVRLDLAVAPPAPVHVTQVSTMPGGDVAIRFNTLPNREHYVEYSDDLRTWRRALEPTPGNSPEASFVDSGPPLTARHPREARARFYRLVAE